MDKDDRLCCFCYYARMRKDICGIYCTGGFVNPDGTCNHFKSHQDHKREKERQKRATKLKDGQK